MVKGDWWMFRRRADNWEEVESRVEMTEQGAMEESGRSKAN